MDKINSIIEQLELEYIEFIGLKLEDRKTLLPLVEPKQIKGLLYNLLTSEKYRKIISYNDYSKIADILFSRLK